MASELFDVTIPILIDLDGSVSNAYDILGQGMHANLPGHRFVLINGLGNIPWKKEYPSMYVSTGDLLKATLRPSADERWASS